MCVYVYIYICVYIFILLLYYIGLHIMFTTFLYHEPNNWPFPPSAHHWPTPAASFVKSLDLWHREGREMRAVDVLFGDGAAERHHLRCQTVGKSWGSTQGLK